MDKNRLTALVLEAKKRFIGALPNAAEIINNTDVIILEGADYEAERIAVFESCGAPVRVYEPSEGEAVIGKTKSKIIIYSFNIKRVNRFRYVLWHELGHVYSYEVNRALFEEAEKDVASNNDTLLGSGLSVWSEYIAESIAYIVENRKPDKYPWAAIQKLQGYLDEAVNTGSLKVYPLAFFYAMAISDPTICLWSETHKGQVPGFNNCDDTVIPLVGNLLNVLGRQLQKDDFVRITPAKLKEVGKHVDILWDYCDIVGRVRYGMSRLIQQGR